LAAILRFLGLAWIAIAGFFVVAVLLFAWYQHGIRHVWSMMNPWDPRTFITILAFLGPGVAFLFLSDAIRQRSPRAVLTGFGGLVLAGLLFGLLVIGVKAERSSTTPSLTRKYKASAVEVLNHSAMMHEQKNYFVTSTTGPVGNEGIPDAIKVGDTVTVRGRTLHVRHIFVTEILEDMKWGGKMLAKKGDVHCMVVASEQDLSSDGTERDRRWIRV